MTSYSSSGLRTEVRFSLQYQIKCYRSINWNSLYQYICLLDYYEFYELYIKLNHETIYVVWFSVLAFKIWMNG